VEHPGFVATGFSRSRPNRSSGTTDVGGGHGDIPDAREGIHHPPSRAGTSPASVGSFGTDKKTGGARGESGEAARRQSHSAGLWHGRCSRAGRLRFGAASGWDTFLHPPGGGTGHG